MKQFLKNFALLTLLTFTLGFVACEEEPEYDTPYIDLSEDIWSLEADGGELTVQIKTNRDWKVEISGNENDDLSWISVSPEEGTTGESEAVISVLENKDEERSAVVRFATETLYKSIKVSQKGLFVEAKGLTEFADDFSSITEAGKEYTDNNWKFYSTSPGIGWLTGYFDKVTPPETSLEIKAFKAQEDQVTAYAMMPAFNVKDAVKKEMTFALAFYYKEFDASKVELVASTDYSGSIADATWEVVKDATIAEGKDMNREVNYTADLSKYADQESVYFAIRYTGKAITYRIYNVKFNKDNGGGGDDPVNPDVPAAVESFADDFSSITAAGQIYENNDWNFFSTDASFGWRTGYFDKVTPAETSLEVKAFKAASDITAYAMMPPFKVKSAQNKTLKFALAYYYKAFDATKVEVVASTDYTGDVTKATWEVVKDCTIAEDEQMNQLNEHAIDLSRYADSDCVFVAFRYTGKEVTYRLYNVSFNKEGGDTPVDPDPEKPVIPEAVESFEDDFSTITSAGQVYSSKNWLFNSTDAELGWRTGYFDKVSPAETSLEVKAYKAADGITAYAMMAPFKVKSAQDKNLKFKLAIYYKNFDDTKVEVVASTDFNGDFNKAGWKVVKNCTIAEDSDMNKKNEYTVDLSEFSGSDCVYVAFRYTGKEVTYRLYDVSFNKDGETPVEPGAPKDIAISELRAMEQGEVMDNYYISGTVVSASNLHGQSIALQDGRKAGSGIIVRTNAKHAFALGEKIKVGIFGGSLSEYNGVLQVSVKDDARIESIASADAANADAMLTTITVDELNEGTYESMYIAIENAQINSEFFGKTFRVGEKDGNVKATADGKEFTIYTNTYASFAQVTVPEGKGTIKGIQAEYKSKQQLLCQRESDFEALKGGEVDPEPQPGEPSRIAISELRAMGTDAEISENLMIEGIVVSGSNLSNKSIALQDDTKANSGIIVRMNSPHTFALGEKLRVSLLGGNLSEYNGVLQMNPADETKVESIASSNISAVDKMLVTISMNDFNTGAYESMYIALEKAQFNSEFFGQTMNGNRTATADGVEFTVYTSQYADFQGVNVPEGKGTIKGVQGEFKGSQQLMCQRESDFADLVKAGNPVTPAGEVLSLGNYDDPDQSQAWDGFNLQNAPVLFTYLHSGSQVIYTPDQIGTMKGQDITSMSFKMFSNDCYIDGYTTNLTLYITEIDGTTFPYNSLVEAYEWVDFDKNNPVCSFKYTGDFLTAYGEDMEIVFNFENNPYRYQGKTLVATIVSDAPECIEGDQGNIQFYWIPQAKYSEYKSLVYGGDKNDFYTNQEKDNVLKPLDNEDKWKDAPIVKFTYNKVGGSVDPEPQPGDFIFYEHFDFCAGSADNPNQKINFDSQLAGWSGENVYEGNGMIKMGSSKNAGNIMTPALTDANGDIVVRFSASAWPKDKAGITIEVTGGGTASVTEFTGLPESKTDLQNFEFTISGATSTTQINFRATNAAKNRFFFDNLEISAK